LTKKSRVCHLSGLAFSGKYLQYFELLQQQANSARIGFRPFLFSRSGSQGQFRNSMAGNLVNDRGQMQNALIISTLGWTLEPLRAFTDLCHKFKLRNLTGTTTVYFAGGSGDPYCDGWQSVSKAIRKLDTIDMNEDVKSDIIRDAEYYYSEQSRQFFADCGIPYRRGYLFFGPPGTGKSSFSAALAGHLQCDIYHINLASGDFSDGNLHRLFLALPRKCIVVIEDIDSAGIGREQGPSAQPVLLPPEAPDVFPFTPSGRRIPAPPGDSHKRNTVTLSGLLNAIDGNASQEGRLLIMTSNNPDALDAALTRPGRIDKKVYFGNMSKSAGRSIYMRLIGRSALAHDAAFTMAEIEQYANEFADKIPANTFTPAQVQNFLQSCRSDPLKALREVDAWVLENRDKPEFSSTTDGSDTTGSNHTTDSSDATSNSNTSASIISHSMETCEHDAILLEGNEYGLSCA
jgi:chaperone BCS1